MVSNSEGALFLKAEERIFDALAFNYRSLSCLHKQLLISADDLAAVLLKLEKGGYVTSRCRSSERPLDYGRPVFGNTSGERQERQYRLTIKGICLRYFKRR